MWVPGFVTGRRGCFLHMARYLPCEGRLGGVRTYCTACTFRWLGFWGNKLPDCQRARREGRHIHTHSLTYLTRSLTYTSIHKYTQGLLIQGYAADEAIVVHLMQRSDRYAVRKKKNNCGGVRDTQPSSLWVSIMSYRATAGHSATLSSCTVTVANNHSAAPPPPTPPPPTRYSPSYDKTT